MSTLHFTHNIVVPNSAARVASADGYFEEIADVKEFMLTQDEYDILRKNKGLFDVYDRNFGTIIDDCEEDRIETSDIEKAIRLTRKFIAKMNDEAEKSAAIKVCEALQYAQEKGVFCEFVNSCER